MADYLHGILDYLREHSFTKAEEALITELQTRQTNLVGASKFSGNEEVENLVDGRESSDGSLCIDRFKDLSLNLDPPSRKLIDGSSNTDGLRELNSSSNIQLEKSRCGSSFKDEFRASDFNSDRQLTKLRDETSFEDSFMALSLNSDAKPTYSRVDSSCENHFRASNSSLDLQTAKLTNGSSYKDEFRGSSLDSSSQLPKLRDASSCLDKFSSLNLNLDLLPINLECGPFNEDHFGASNLQLGPQVAKTRHESSHRGDTQSKGGSSYLDKFSYLNLSSEHHLEISRDGSSCEDGSTDLNLHLYPQPPKSRDESLYIDQFRSLSLQPSFETNQSHVSASATRDNLTDGQSGCEPNSVNVSAFREWRRDHDCERMTENVQNEKEELTGSDTFDNSVFSLRFNQLFEKNPSNLTSRMDEWQNRVQRKHNEDTFMDPRAVQPQACTNIYGINGNGEKELSPNRITHLQPPRYDEAQDANLQSFSRFAYNAPINNGWMDFGFPLSGVLKRPTKGHSNLPPFVTDDGSGVMSRQQEEDDGIDFLKTNKKGRENDGDDFVTNLTFPWELGTPNSFGVDEIFSNESQTEKFSSWHPAKFKPTIKDLCLKKEDDHGYELNTSLPGNNQGYANTVFEENYNLGSFLDIPIGQGVALPGDKHDCGINELLPLSQSLMQDSPELLSGFATLGDDPTGSGIEYPKDYWDSDTYDDDEDPGYHRQPIEDEAWFLAHEIEYPSDDDRVTSNNEKEVIYPLQDGSNEISSNALNIQGSYSSGKQMYNTIENVTQTVPNSEVCTATDLFGNTTLKETLKQRNAISYDGQLMDSEDLKLMGIKESLFSREKKHSELAPQENVKTTSIKSGNFCLNSVKETEKKNFHEPTDFSFPSPSSTDIPLSQDIDNYDTGASRLADALTWRQESKVSSSTSSQRNMGRPIILPSKEATVKVKHESFVKMDEIRQSDANVKDEESLSGIDDRDNALLQDELEQMKVQEDLEQIKMQEDFEIFTLRIVHRKNRTGFEEEKDFPIVLNSIVAGRYLVTEYLGSAAFSKAVQARDLQTGVDVCMKIVKNNKDFFDQSLDEIKLLKYINKHDPADSHHLLRLYDYFYYREHLFLVCELLRANLYEFQKFNRESGGEIYFTMPRLQSITRQCLEALEFLHGLGLIHCDLKPENILIKSYSRCEIKVIDLGSSCFQTDHLCSYVQSRSYRAPEVILGLPYDQKIDIWSLGCILAELCSGNVLFQNDSLATLLARVIGIIGPIVPDMILKGREAHKYFTKNFMLYDRNQATNMLEYVIPKKTSLRHRIPAGDQGFVDFVAYLLQIHPESRPTASEALKHPWLTYPYDPILT